MQSTIKYILKVSISNICSLIAGVLIGFLIPKIMGLEDYANYKIYSLYVTYLAFLSLGFGDGIYLKYSGIDKDKLDKTELNAQLRKYYAQLAIGFLITVLAAFFVNEKYKFIIFALAFTILSSQITAVHQSLSLLTSSFGEYSLRIVIKSILSVVLVFILFGLYKYKGCDVQYQYFVVGTLMIEYVTAFWYVWTYREFNFCKNSKSYICKTPYKSILAIGFPLLLSNMAASIFLNLDRQFVSVLFKASDYAVYAFAYNMMTLITTMTSAISLVVFPTMKKAKIVNIKAFLNKYMGVFSLFMLLSLCLYFPLCIFIPFFLPKYIQALEIFRIVLPGIMFSSTVSVLLINMYKIENRMMSYLIRTLISIGISALLNYIAFKMFHSYYAISWASIISLFVWYLMTLMFFVRKYRVKWLRSTITMLLGCLIFYVTTSCFDKRYIFSGVIYIVLILIVGILFWGKTIINTKKE